MAFNGFKKLNEATLLKRTLVYVAAFVVASLVFVGIMSFALLSIAKAILPSKGTEDAEAKAETSATATSSSRVGSAKNPRVKRVRPSAGEAPPTSEE